MVEVVSCPLYKRVSSVEDFSATARDVAIVQLISGGIFRQVKIRHNSKGRYSLGGVYAV